MTTPSPEQHTPSFPLPTVSPDICAAVASEIMTDTTYIKDSFAIMHDENPHMTESLSRIIMELSGEDKQIGQAQMLTSAVVYRALRAQAEADSMNRQFSAQIE